MSTPSQARGIVSSHTQYRFTLPSGESITGGVVGRGGGYLGPGQVGAIKADLVHAELGLSLLTLGHTLGSALVTDAPGYFRLVPLYGVEVSPA